MDTHGTVSFGQFVAMTASWCVCAAYRLAAAAHAQKLLLDETRLLEIEKLAIEQGREASEAQSHALAGGDKGAAIDQGVKIATDLFAKFREQRGQ